MGRWSTIPIITRDNRLRHFYSCNVLKNETHFVLEYPLYNPLRDKFQSHSEKVVGSLKSFFQLDHPIDISLYLMEASTLCYSRKLVGFTPPRCIFNPINLSALKPPGLSRTLKPIPFHFVQVLLSEDFTSVPQISVLPGPICVKKIYLVIFKTNMTYCPVWPCPQGKFEGKPLPGLGPANPLI